MLNFAALRQIIPTDTIATPAPVNDASWQPGVIDGSDTARVLLDGEPQPLAFAAKAGARGWVWRYRDHAPRRRKADGPSPALLPVDLYGRTPTERKVGVVRIVRGDPAFYIPEEFIDNLPLEIRAPYPCGPRGLSPRGL